MKENKNWETLERYKKFGQGITISEHGFWMANCRKNLIEVKNDVPNLSSVKFSLLGIFAFEYVGSNVFGPNGFIYPSFEFLLN